MIYMDVSVQRGVIDSINKISAFLSKRDIDELSSCQLSAKFGIPRVDLLIILGNSMPDTALIGAAAYERGLAEKLMIVGGIGHSTKYLIQNVQQDKRYEGIRTDGKPEADILKDIIIDSTNIREDEIIIENNSTNCGSNAVEALKVLKALDKVPESFIIIQDPTMQLRTHASFQKAWAGEKAIILSYAPFIPLVREEIGGLEFVNRGISGLWSAERFIDLTMGEIPRLRDDEKGYGPKGKDFIAHVDIPDNVLEAYEKLLCHFNDYSDIRSRK